MCGVFCCRSVCGDFGVDEVVGQEDTEVDRRVWR